MKVRPLILTALFAVLTAAGALIRIPTPFSAVTLQFFCTAAAGVLLGAKYGAVSQILYVLLGLVGLPVFAMGGGVGVLSEHFPHRPCALCEGYHPALRSAYAAGRKPDPSAAE